ncbi:hypothetical protein BDQ17DRAFT_1429056 [Cyathus striatus]|nr:hypothetical protein BDQ17DRAFT_1429056 [Cyathus striatus]
MASERGAPAFHISSFLSSAKLHTSDLLFLSRYRQVAASTRKLGAIPGTTPFLVSAPPAPIPIPSSPPAQGKYREQTTPLTKKSWKDGEEGEEGYRYVFNLPRSFFSPFRKKQKVKEGRKSASASAVPVSSGDPRAGVRDSVLSTNNTSIKSLLSLTFPSTTTDTPNRRKLSKLPRTFGEPVPPELVFPPRTASPSVVFKLKKQAEKPQGPQLSARERRLRREGRGKARSGSISHSSRRAPRPRSLMPLPPLPPLPSLLALSTLPAPRRSYDSSSEEEVETPPTSTDDYPVSLKAYLSALPFPVQNSTTATRAPLSSSSSARHSHSFSTRPRTTSSSSSRTSEDKARRPMHVHSRTFGDVPSPCEEEDEEYGHMREREWSGE